jgi:hypothetical protein
MDSPITATARALAAGDPIGALNRIALRGDAPAVALRGIAMTQRRSRAQACSHRSRAVQRDAQERRELVFGMDVFFQFTGQRPWLPVAPLP